MILLLTPTRRSRIICRYSMCLDDSCLIPIPTSTKDCKLMMYIIIGFLLGYGAFVFGKDIWNEHFAPETLAPLAPGATFAPTFPPTIAPTVTADTRDALVILGCGVHYDQHHNFLYLLVGLILTYTVIATFLPILVIHLTKIDKETTPTAKVFKNSFFLNIFFALIVGLGLCGRFYYVGKKTMCE